MKPYAVSGITVIPGSRYWGISHQAQPQDKFQQRGKAPCAWWQRILDVPVLDIYPGQRCAREAQSLQCSVLEYAPECNAVQDYKKLIQELIQRGLRQMSKSRTEIDKEIMYCRLCRLPQRDAKDGAGRYRKFRRRAIRYRFMTV